MKNKERIDQLEQELAELRAHVALLQAQPAHVPILWPNTYTWPNTHQHQYWWQNPLVSQCQGVN